MSDQVRDLALDIVRVLDDKKAQNVELYHLGSVPNFADYFVIATGTSTTQVKALADEVEDKMAEKGFKLKHKEGYQTASWILLNYFEVVVHIFHPEARNFYNLERLWADVPQVDLEEILKRD
ncbi:MAG: ribosome silencing factor [Hyphomonadaceae bacterium]|nr:ribosome silencing factor [Clostridia bacterium]